MGVLEDGVLVEHYIDQATNVSMAGNIYLGRVQNVLPSMEAAFVDIGKGRNAVLYAGEVNWDAAGLEAASPSASSTPSARARRSSCRSPRTRSATRARASPRRSRCRAATSSTCPNGLDDRHQPQAARHRARPPEEDPARGRARQRGRHRAHRRRGGERGGAARRRRAPDEPWEDIQAKAEASSTRERQGKGRRRTAARSARPAPALHGEPDLAIRVVRDVFNEDFTQLVVQGDAGLDEIQPYIDLGRARPRRPAVTKWTSEEDLFAAPPRRRAARQGHGPQGLAAVAAARSSSTAPRR